MRTHRGKEFWRQGLIGGLLFGAATLACADAGADTDTGTDGLGAALQATLRNHPAVAGQQAKVDALHHTVKGARSQRYPTLTAQAQQFAQGNRSSVSGDDLSQPAVLSIRQPLWSFGRIKYNIAAASADLGSEQADLLLLRRQLLEATAVAYARVRGNDETVAIARQNVADHEGLLAQIERRVTGELASSADGRLAATRLAQARADLQRALSDWEGAQAELVGFTQVSVGTQQPVPPKLLQLRESSDLVAEIVAQDAQVLLKQKQLGRADAEIDRARSSSMPTLYLQADRFHDQPALVDDSQVSLVFEASLDGLGLAARNRTGEAVASRRAAEQDLAATKVDLRRELEGLQRSRRLESELIALQTQSLDDLESLLTSYQRQYESGSKSWLDLMNLQRELFEQRRQQVRSRNAWLIYSLQLQARSGGLDRLAGMPEQDNG